MNQVLLDMCMAGEHDDAIALGEREILANPDSLVIRMRLVTMHASLGRFDEALAHLVEAEARADPTPAVIHVQRARVEFLSGRGSARASARRAIELDPAQIQFFYYLAEHRLQGDYMIVNDPNIIYSPIPKSGSTSIKALFAGPGERPHQKFSGDRLRTDRIALAETDVASYYRFAIVRDDIERFASYHARNIVGSESLRRAANGRGNLFGLSTVPSIGELVDNLSLYQYVFLDVLHHTLPSRAHMHRDRSFYDDVFDITQMADLHSVLADRCGLDREIPHRLRSDTPPPQLNDKNRSALMDYFATDPA